MNNYNSKLKFNQFTLNSHYLRVDDKHPLELLIGLNDLGQKTIRFIGEFTKTKIKGTKTIEVNHFTLKGKFVLSFSLLDNDYVDLFYLFCNDLIDSSRDIVQDDGYTYLVNRYEKWRGFGSSSHKYLSENEIKGLIGELLFLKELLFDKYGISKSILGWTGTEPLKKDYSFDDYWFEIKAVTKDVVTISSIEQLDSDSIGFLILYYLEKLSSEATAVTINQVVNEILEMISIEQDKSLFILKLVQAGFYKEEYYDQFVYRKSKVEFFEVTDDFPRLSHDSLPSAISNVRYDLIINMLEKFKRDDIWT